jgi:hypothetical protein
VNPPAARWAATGRCAAAARCAAVLCPALALFAVLALALPPAGADAKQLRVTGGQVKATLTYTRSSDPTGYKTQNLTIERAGQKLFTGVPSIKACKGFECSPTVGLGPRQPPLIVRDLDGDGEPEVVYSAFTGGAHCCSVAAFYELAAGATRYASVERDFGDPGFGIKDLDHDGLPEVVTADDAFAYRFTSYAFSGLPMLVLRYDHGHFKGITSGFKTRLRTEARDFWKGYKNLRASKDDTPRGQISAWAADEYRLGRRTHALAVLRREVRRGHLAHPGGGASFIRALDRFLKRRGYA